MTDLQLFMYISGCIAWLAVLSFVICFGAYWRCDKKPTDEWRETDDGGEG